MKIFINMINLRLLLQMMRILNILKMNFVTDEFKKIPIDIVENLVFLDFN